MEKIINEIFKRKDNKLNQYPCNVYFQQQVQEIMRWKGYYC